MVLPGYGMVEYHDRERMNVKAYWVLYDTPIKDLTKIIIPKSKWIVLRLNSQIAKEVQDTSDNFYFDFMPSCQYNYRDIPDIEYYHNNITDLYFPIED